MATRAYNELYLASAQTTLATMFDYAVNYKHDNIDLFFTEFVASGISDMFGLGNPNVITGKSGVELYHDIKNVFCIQTSSIQYISINRTPEFWFGYYLAYAQWYINRSFRDISFSILPSEMLSMYSLYHEIDPKNFAEFIEQKVINSNHNLKAIRTRNGYGQTELANLSGVEIRNIQSFEQCKNNIAKAQFDTLNSLSLRLNCSISDLTQSYNLKQILLNNQIKYIQYSTQHRQMVENYINQFPYNSTAYYNNNYYINNNSFTTNLQNYWSNVKHGLDLVKLITDYKPVKLVSNGLGIINSINLIELTYKIAELTNDISK